MLRVAIVDANEHTNPAYRGMACSVIAGWLKWECKQANVPIVPAQEADLVLLAFAGAIGWRDECRRALKRAHVEPDASGRARRPYVVTGGPIDALPLVALELADALVVGEGYRYVRQMLGLADVRGVEEYTRTWPHAIERGQVQTLARQEGAPWLLAAEASPLASPDDVIDWDVPPMRSDDKVVRLIASKGCHFKCGYCATSYRQTYQCHPRGGRVVGQLTELAKRRERVQMVSNDPMNLPWFRQIASRLDSQSFTLQEVRDQANRAVLTKSGIGMARFGVEGVSERIRRAFGKPVSDNEVLEVVADLHAHKVNTHLFFISGAPWETETDWQAFRAFYERLGRTISNGICRVKLTTYLPTPPAPLARFVTGAKSEKPMADMMAWIPKNAASRHVVSIMGRRGRQHVADVAEQLSVSADVAEQLMRRLQADIAPTLDHWMRLPHNLIQWPIRPDLRYKVSEVYQRRMAHVPTTTAT